MSFSSLWAVRQAAGEPLAVVRVRQLRTTCTGPQDAWGRAAAAQPVTISAELHFARAFAAAAADDRVTAGDTVHYGELSKRIVACVERSNERAAGAAGGGGGGSSSSSSSSTVALRVLLERIWCALTGLNANGENAAPGAAAAASPLPPPLLDLARLRFMSLTVMLPKASLLGEGVSLTAANVFPPDSASLSMYGLALRVHRLRVPTLIGVNANERKAHQFVVTDVELDRFDYPPDLYCELEALVVKAMEKSSFETLEALGAELCSTIIRDLKPNPKDLAKTDEGWQVKLSMAKPTAVPSAECPVIEMRFSSKP